MGWLYETQTLNGSVAFEPQRKDSKQSALCTSDGRQNPWH